MPNAAWLCRYACSLAAATAISLAVFISTQPPLLARALPPYTVTSAQDLPKLPGSGTECKSTQLPNHPCTLRAAIETVNTSASGTSINVPGNFLIMLDAALGELNAQVPMSIISVGDGSATVDGSLQTRILHTTDANAGVTITGLTLRHGRPVVGSDQTGGGIWNEGRLTLNNVVVTASEGKNVGGIIDSGSLTMNGGAVIANTATEPPGSVESSVAGGLAVVSGAAATVTATSFVNNKADYGGGIVSFGTAILQSVHLVNNSATQLGGALLAGVRSSNPPLGPADVTIADSTIRANTAGEAGAGIFLGAGELAMTGSTASGNAAPGGSGGGIFVAAGSSAVLTNDTVAGNSAAQGGGIAQATFNIPTAQGRGGVGAFVSPLPQRGFVETRRESSRPAAGDARPDGTSLGSVTLAANSAQAGGEVWNEVGLSFTVQDTIVGPSAGTAGVNCFGSVTSGGYNLESRTDCGFHASGDKSNLDPQLGGLANNGGPTQTMALQANSPAIDAGGPVCPPPTTDQRGVKRPQGFACDVGAFEVRAAALPAPPSTGHAPAQPPS